MTDLLTSLQQQIEMLSSALCQIPGSLYLKSTSGESIKNAVDITEGLPDIQSISDTLASLIDALPSIQDSDNIIPKQKEQIVQLWSDRNALDEQLDQATELLQRLHERLTVLHEAVVIHSSKITRKRKSESQDLGEGRAIIPIESKRKRL